MDHDTRIVSREKHVDRAIPSIDINDQRFSLIDPQEVGNCCYAMLSQAQNFKPIVQVAALCLLLYVATTRMKAHAGDILERGRLIAQRGKCPPIEAVHLYAANEIK